MEKPIITIKNISKKYDINHLNGKYVALRDVLTHIAKNPFNFLKHKAKVITGLEKKEEFWALKDINLEIKKGEVLGIIGHNGAGKSTLLKILSQITPPTTGEIKINGRVGSLLEVGTGFHPELSGRENIFLNAAILGMSKREIEKKFDQIVEFAGIEKFLDTPVKRYSSGMYVRLAFSVAAHMEPDILIIDEVLAVGDAEFQKKCLGKMDEVTKQDGRTIIFVSHNLNAVQQLCKKTVVLSQGKIKFAGDTDEAIKLYTDDLSQQINKEDLSKAKRKRSQGNTRFSHISFYNKEGREVSRVQSGEPLTIGLSYKSKGLEELENCRVSVSFRTISGESLFICSTDLVSTQNLNLPALGEVKCHIENLPLNRGKYIMSLIFQVNKQIEDWIDDGAILEVDSGDFYESGASNSYWEGKGVLVKHNWLI